MRAFESRDEPGPFLPRPHCRLTPGLGSGRAIERGDFFIRTGKPRDEDGDAVELFVHTKPAY